MDIAGSSHDIHYDDDDYDDDDGNSIKFNSPPKNNIPLSPEDEIISLQKKMEQIQEQLNVQLRLNTVLAQSKEQLGTEVDELTLALFEEANNLVRVEAEEKSRLRKRNQFLEDEISSLRKGLELEREELKNLKTSIIISDLSKGTNASPPLLSPKPNPSLIPRKLDSKIILKGPFSSDWIRIHHSLNQESLKSFSLFLDRIIRGELGRVFQKIREVKDKNLEKFILTRLVNDNYFRDIWNGEILPIISFPYKKKPPHLSIGMLCRAMLHSDTIILLPLNSSSSSSCTTTSTSSSSSGGEEDQYSYDIEIFRERGSPFMSSLPDTVLGFFKSPKGPPVLSPKSSIPSPQSDCCMLCGLPNALPFRVSSHTVFIDSVCESKLTSVQALFRWIMRLQESVLLTRPLIDMYYELLEIRRMIFYCGRLPPGSREYFQQADLEDSWNSLVNG